MAAHVTIHRPRSMWPPALYWATCGACVWQSTTYEDRAVALAEASQHNTEEH